MKDDNFVLLAPYIGTNLMLGKLGVIFDIGLVGINNEEPMVIIELGLNFNP